jgi:hypothetical protein
VKRDLIEDPRYDAVGSSSLREELFNTFLKGKSLSSAAPVEDAPKAADTEEREESYEEQQKKRRERAEQAVKEREEKVRADLGRVEAEIGRSRQLGDKEEGEMLFKCAAEFPLTRAACGLALISFSIIRSMLTDAIRDPQVRDSLGRVQYLIDLLDYLGRRCTISFRGSPVSKLSSLRKYRSRFSMVVHVLIERPRALRR